MSGSIAAELFMLRKRTATAVLLGIWTALTVVFGYVLPYTIGTAAEDGPGSSAVAELFPGQITGTITGGFPFYGGALVLMLGVLSVGSEYGWGTLKTLFTQRPGRLQVFAAKMIALGIVLIAFVLASFAVGALSSAVIAMREGAEIVWPSATLLLRSMLTGWFIFAVWAAFGVMLAVLSRGTSLAIGIGILWTLAVEGLLSALANGIEVFEPLVQFFVRANAYSLVKPLGSLAGASSDGPGRFTGPFVSSPQAVLVLGAYLIVFLALSAWLLRRRDVA